MPDDFYTELGLAALISPLRLRGMSAMLARIKRHLRWTRADDRARRTRHRVELRSHARRLNCLGYILKDDS